jgi:hypothetical protein
MQKNDLARAVNDVMEGCKMARDRAILQGIPYDFTLSGAGEMNISPAPIRDANMPSKPGGEFGETVSPPTVEAIPSGTVMSGFPRKLGEDVMIQLIDVNFIDHMQAEEARVRFYPNGISDHFTVVLNWQGKQRTVNLDIITGTPEELIAQ